MNARSVADVEQAADAPEVLTHSDNAVDVGIIDDECGGFGAVGVMNGVASPVANNCVGN